MNRACCWKMVLLIGGAFLSSPAWGAVVYRDVADLTRQAKRIVIGDVVEVSSSWKQEHTLIESRIVVSIDAYLVGEGSGLEVLRMSGGTIGELTLRVSVLPTFEVGDHVLLFLGNPVIGLVESFQGAYLTDGEQIARMTPAHRGIIPESLQALDDFLGEIAGALPPGTSLPKIAPYEGDFELPLGGQRYVLCGVDWTYMANPMGESYVINANCADGSCGSADSQRTQIQNGADAWTNAGADFAFTYGGTSTQTFVSLNGTNLVYFDTTPPDGGGYLAATYFWFSGNSMTECDMVFDDQHFTWWDGSGGCSGMYDIWAVAAHEFGHFLCLTHSFAGTTMYFAIGSCDTNPRSLHSDDIAGILAIYGAASDAAPPSPNPMGWATEPNPTGTTAISMEATLATDETAPVYYLFDFVSGGSGGSDSSWQTSRTYADGSLSANTGYTYRVKARDSASPWNETGYSANATSTTHIETPTGVSFPTVAVDSIVLDATGPLTNLGVGWSAVYFDSTTSGGDGGINVWVESTTDTATGLDPNAEYTFLAKARNQDALETEWSASASVYTLAIVPEAPTLSDVTADTIDLAVNPAGNPSNTNFAIQCASTDPFDSTWDGKYLTASGDPADAAVWQTDADWGTITVLGLSVGTEYSFHVKARNENLIETALGPASSATTVECANSADCDDSLFCNGEESCDPLEGCLQGAYPCPGQACVEAEQNCVPLPTAVTALGPPVAEQGETVVFEFFISSDPPIDLRAYLITVPCTLAPQAEATGAVDQPVIALDSGRGDWVMCGAGCDCTCLGVPLVDFGSCATGGLAPRVGWAAIFTSDSATVGEGPFYLAEASYVVSADASGEFDFEFVDPENQVEGDGSSLRDPDGAQIYAAWLGTTLVVGVCSADAECDDGVDCTVDTCDPQNPKAGGDNCVHQYQQRLFGDIVPPFCQPECPQPGLDDILCQLDDFALGAEVNGCGINEPPESTDLHPCGGGDGVMGLDDILYMLDAFAQDPPCPDPCP